MSRKPTLHVEAPNPHAESIDASAIKDLISNHYGTKPSNRSTKAGGAGLPRRRGGQSRLEALRALIERQRTGPCVAMDRVDEFLTAVAGEGDSEACG